MRDEPVINMVDELTTTLSALAIEYSSRANRVKPTAAARCPSVSLYDVARKLLAERHARAEFFPAELFHEPAWDMLLALYVADEDRHIMNVKALVAAASAPVTTSQRWIDHLHKLKLIHRVTDPMDRRRVEVSLSDAGLRAILAFLERVDA